MVADGLLPHRSLENPAYATPETCRNCRLCPTRIMTPTILDDTHIHPAIRQTIVNNRADALAKCGLLLPPTMWLWLA
jgi:hypothetical protein